MNADHREQAEWMRRVDDLLNKTMERGATADEEKSAVQLAYQLTRQHGLDIGEFKARLETIGAPPRYLVTADGFLLPTRVVEPARRWDGTERRRRAATPEQERSGGHECPASPTGRHFMVPLMRGTFPSGIENCAHCGARKK
jgi:hypothetical protein